MNELSYFRLLENPTPQLEAQALASQLFHDLRQHAPFAGQLDMLLEHQLNDLQLPHAIIGLRHEPTNEDPYTRETIIDSTVHQGKIIVNAVEQMKRTNTFPHATHLEETVVIPFDMSESIFASIHSSTAFADPLSSDGMIAITSEVMYDEYGRITALPTDDEDHKPWMHIGRIGTYPFPIEDIFINFADDGRLPQLPHELILTPGLNSPLAEPRVFHLDGSMYRYFLQKGLHLPTSINLTPADACVVSFRFSGDYGEAKKFSFTYNRSFAWKQETINIFASLTAPNTKLI